MPERGTSSLSFWCHWWHGTPTDVAANIGIHRDGNIRYFEYENDKFEFLNEYKSAEPQRGIAFIPRRGINVRAAHSKEGDNVEAAKSVWC